MAVGRGSIEIESNKRPISESSLWDRFKCRFTFLNGRCRWRRCIEEEIREENVKDLVAGEARIAMPPRPSCVSVPLSSLPVHNDYRLRRSFVVTGIIIILNPNARIPTGPNKNLTSSPLPFPVRD